MAAPKKAKSSRDASTAAPKTGASAKGTDRQPKASNAPAPSGDTLKKHGDKLDEALHQHG